MERKLIANYLVPDDEVWVSPTTWERPFSLEAKESTVTDTQQLKAEIASIASDLECIININDETKDRYVKRLRQLSAV